MSRDEVACPSCGAKLEPPPGLDPTSLVACPRCQHSFPLRPLEDVAFVSESFVSVSAIQAPPTSPPPNPAFRSAIPPTTRAYELGSEEGPRPRTATFDANYSIEFTDWLGIGWSRVREMALPFLAFLVVSFVCVLVVGCVPFFGALALVLVGPSLVCGPYVVALQILRRRFWDFNTFFAGFYHMGNLLLLQFLVPLAGAFSSIPLLVGGAIADGDPVIVLICASGSFLLFSYLFVRGFFFAPLIIVDRGTDPFEAVSLSWRLTEGHVIGLAAVVLALLFVAVVGLLFFLMGVLVTVPLALLTQTAGYLLITRQEDFSEIDHGETDSL